MPFNVLLWEEYNSSHYSISTHRIINLSLLAAVFFNSVQSSHWIWKTLQEILYNPENAAGEKQNLLVI